MTSNSLSHDVAWATARDIVEVFAGCLREDERRDAFIEVYTRVKASLERFQVMDDRMQRRMRPGVNLPRESKNEPEPTRIVRNAREL